MADRADNDMTDDAAIQLLAAAMAGRADDVKKLLAAGVSPLTEKDAVVRGILPALDMTRTDLSLFRLLNLHPAAEKLSAPLYLAALQGHADIVEIFLQRQDARASLNIALVGAVMGGQAALTQKILHAGADVSFENYAALAESIMGGHDDIAAQLQRLLSPAQKPAAFTRALEACIAAGRPEKTADYLMPGADVFPALRAACRALCTQKVTRPARAAEASAADYEDALDMMLGFAEAAGGKTASGTSFESDMKKLAADLLPTAVQEQATPVVRRLLAYGASAETALDYAVTQGLPDLAAAALARGAEPRQGGGAAVRRAQELAVLIGSEPRRDLRDLLVQVAAVRTEADRAALQAAGPLSVPVLLKTLRRETAETGLILAIETDQAEKAFALFAQNPADLTAEFLLQADANGRSALSRLCGKEQGALVLSPVYWQGRLKAYEQVAQAVLDKSPAGQKDALEKRCAETRQALAAQQNRQALEERARQAKNRLRFK
jgi:hypothetical protein